MPVPSPILTPIRAMDLSLRMRAGRRVRSRHQVLWLTSMNCVRVSACDMRSSPADACKRNISSFFAAV